MKGGGAPDPLGPVTSADRRLALVALGTAVFTVLAVVLEIAAGVLANSAVPAWATRLVPLAWPRVARVAWWLTVAAAMATFHGSLHRLGLGQARLLVVASVAPFLIFAAGVATGQSWSTFH